MISFFERFKIPVAIVFFACQFIWFRSNANFLDWDSLTLPAIMGFIFLSGFWFFLLVDIINTKIYNKTFWLISMLIMPWFAPVVYLFQRRKFQQIKTNSLTGE